MVCGIQERRWRLLDWIWEEDLLHRHLGVMETQRIQVKKSEFLFSNWFSKIKKSFLCLIPLFNPFSRQFLTKRTFFKEYIFRLRFFSFDSRNKLIIQLDRGKK